MQGLVLDRTAPLYGRADEILRLGPLPAGHIRRALRTDDPVRAVEDYAVWGGVPRYWELAARLAVAARGAAGAGLEPARRTA